MPPLSSSIKWKIILWLTYEELIRGGVWKGPARFRAHTAFMARCVHRFEYWCTFTIFILYTLWTEQEAFSLEAMVPFGDF